MSFIITYTLAAILIFVVGFNTGEKRRVKKVEASSAKLKEEYSKIINQATAVVVESTSNVIRHSRNVQQVIAILEDHLDTTNTQLDPDIELFVNEIKNSYIDQTMH